MLPLDGVTVIAIEQAVAAPFASRHLADLGARVIKIERPRDGDFARAYDQSVCGTSSYFAWLNRSKESLGLDIKSAEGRDILATLIAGADVFLHNLAPGAVERLGFGSAQLCARHPRLVSCTISGFGVDGEWAERKAYDLLIQAEVGLVALTGTPDHPAKAGISVADIAAGTYAFNGILAALLGRERTGRGTALEVSLFDALAEWMGAPLVAARHGARPPRRVGAAHATIAPYGPYAAADGTVFLAVQNEREWVRLCDQVLGDASLAEDVRFSSNPRRVANRDELDALIGATLGTDTVDHLTDVLDRAGIARASMNELAAVVDHPVLRDRSRWTTVSMGESTVSTMLPPVVDHAFAARMGPIPEVGEHTEGILRELGYDADDMAHIRACGVI